MRKRKYTPKSFESMGNSNDTSANIYESMLRSPAFIDLTKNQRLLYLYCKAQYYGKKKPGKDFPDVEQLQGDEMFYFDLSAAEQYNLYSSGGRTRFYNDMQSLESHGFIKKVSSGKNTKSRNIYEFSGGWRTWHIVK